MIAVTIIIVVVLLLIFVLWYVRCVRLRFIYEIPGPPGLPIIGNIFQVSKSSGEVWKTFRKWGKEYYPIYKLTSIHERCVALLSAEDIGMVLSGTIHTEKGSLLYTPLRSWLREGLLTSFGNKWHDRRKIITPTFHFNILKEFSDIFFKLTEELVTKIDEEIDKGPIDVVPLISESMLKSIVETAMGIRLDFASDDISEYIDSLYKIGKIIAYRATRPIFTNKLIYKFTKTSYEEAKVLKTLHHFTNSVIRKRIDELRRNSGENVDLVDDFGRKKRIAFLDFLIQKMENGDIDEMGIQEEVDTFMFEVLGHDTTSVSICFTLMLLANHPQIQETARNEIQELTGGTDRNLTYYELNNLHYLEMVIKESLRLYPSVPHISRKLGEDFRTSTGYFIKKGTEVVIHIHDLHMNPKIWPNPNHFFPDRFLPENSKGRHPFAHLPFSAGSRNCIGQKYAMLELKIVISGILRKFLLTQVDTPESIVPVVDMVNRTKSGIRVNFSKLSSSDI